jgi:hypothetical protein
VAADWVPGKRASQWVVLARDRKHLEALTDLPDTMTVEGRPLTLAHWENLAGKKEGPLWTDDFSNLTQILNWRYILPWEE